MIRLTFPPPAPPLNMNDRAHWAKKAQYTALWRGAAWAAAVANVDGTPDPNDYLPRSVVQLVLPVDTLKRRRDPHNYYPTVKACVDGLVDAGLWPDDTAEYVATVEPRFKVGGDVEIEIEAM